MVGWGKGPCTAVPRVSLCPCHPVQVGFPSGGTFRSTGVVSPPLPEPHPVPGVRGILEVVSYCLCELCFVLPPAKKGLTCKTLFGGELVWRQLQSTVLQEYFGIQHLKGERSLFVCDKKNSKSNFYAVGPLHFIDYVKSLKFGSYIKLNIFFLCSSYFRAVQDHCPGFFVFQFFLLYLFSLKFRGFEPCLKIWGPALG